MVKNNKDSLKTAIANIEIDVIDAMKEIDNVLDVGWRQVDERIEELRELECVKEELINKWSQVNGKP